METKNARIERTTLGYEHGCLVAYLHLDFGDSLHGAFGGYMLDTPLGRPDDYKRVGTAGGLQFIISFLETVGVSKWEDLVGKHVRVVGDCSLGSGPPRVIGHITEDKWFDIEAWAREWFYEKD